MIARLMTRFAAGFDISMMLFVILSLAGDLLCVDTDMLFGPDPQLAFPGVLKSSG